MTPVEWVLCLSIVALAIGVNLHIRLANRNFKIIKEWMDTHL